MKPIINHRGPEFRDLYRGLIEKVKFVFQTKGDVFILSSSGTGAVECAIGNITSTGTKILVPTYGVFSKRLHDSVATFGGKAIEIPVEWGDAPTSHQIEEALQREKDIAAVAIVSNETSTGVRVKDLEVIGKICADYGSLLIVDAISNLGGDYLPVDEWGIDICATGVQKCLMTPPGLALVSISEKAWDKIKETRRSCYFDLQAYKRYQAELETPYTPALNLYYALNEALDMIREEGLERRFKRHKVCANAIYAGIESMGLIGFAKPEVRSNTVIAVKNPAGIADKELRDILREKYRIIIAGGMGKLKGSTFRIGSMGSVSRFEVLATISALEYTLLELGWASDLGTGLEAAGRILAQLG
jgi:aspartate aminotransferase-like enzyme